MINIRSMHELTFLQTGSFVSSSSPFFETLISRGLNLVPEGIAPSLNDVSHLVVDVK